MTSLLPTQKDGVMTLLRKDFETFRDNLPTKVEDTVNTLPICVLEKAVEPSTIQQYLEAEITRTSVQMNVANNMRQDQVIFCAETLLEMFPVQSLEDFSLCLKRLSMGFYGTTYHQLDTAVIVDAMHKYIEEKSVYMERENQKQGDSEPIPDVDYAAFKKRREAMQVREAEERQADFNRKRMEAEKEAGYIMAKSSYKTDPEKAKEILLREQWRRDTYDPIKQGPGISFEEWLTKQ